MVAGVLTHAVFVPFATASGMLWIQVVGFAGHWDNVPLLGALGVLVDVASRGEIGLTAPTSEMFVLVAGAIAAILYSWLWLLALEDTVIARPTGVEPIEERWPEWLLDGLGDRDV